MAQTIITIAPVITALGVILGVILTVHKWYLKNEKQDNDIKAIKDEQTILTKGVLACLKSTERLVNRPCLFAKWGFFAL